MIPWPGAIEWVGGRYTWDDLVVVRSPTTMRHPLWGGAWEGYTIEQFQQKFRTGNPPMRALRASVLHIGMHHCL